MKNKNKKLWLKVAEMAEDPRYSHSPYSGRYTGLCILLYLADTSLLRDPSRLTSLRNDLRDVMNCDTDYFWETHPMKTDNGDRILGAYFMAYSGLTSADV